MFQGQPWNIEHGHHEHGHQ